MKKSLVAVAGLAVCTAGLVSTSVSVPVRSQSPTPPPAPIDATVLHVQVLLDHLGFGPGVIDGRGGMTLKAALRGFQDALGLTVTGEIDQPTLRALYPYRAIRPVRALTVSAADASGPYQGPLPKDPAAQAQLPALGYADALEKLAEKFHTTPATLAALNPGGKITPGARLRFPNVLPASRQYDPKLKPEWRRTLSDLNINAEQPQAERILVDKSEGVLKVYGADDRLLAQFPATMGSEHDPLPLGRWKIQGASYNPPFHYNPDLFWDAKAKDRKQLLPAGPNGPVGVIWLDLSKPHYGIHGTPSPETIGRAESHGCIRLTNWDAARLSLMVKPGTPALFQA
ncbi:MAG TPA: L,D-transpeptidase family protein [Sphingomonas sp.]|jgi:lipoprotein-anchoring transpeptidase ErfK/SrfK|uniref:L,D-transpeptidase family protein n=1 Tax=Sphingomonas sp. TaxID=28214 RepID=UPI002EFE4CA1